MYIHIYKKKSILMTRKFLIVIYSTIYSSKLSTQIFIEQLVYLRAPGGRNSS